MYTLNSNVSTSENMKINKTKNYKVIHYNKDKVKSNEDLLYRSVIMNNEDKFVSFSPPKSIDYMTFKANNTINNVVIDEIIEGTMIHMFYDNDAWRISTKSKMDAKSSYFYYGNYNRTFEKMFQETTATFSEDWREKLDKNYCYSFVLQHPYNRIVVPIYCKKLYLISIYHIDGEQVNVVNIEKENLPREFYYPQKYNMNSYLEIEKMMESENYNSPGFMIKTKVDRTKLLYKGHQYVKELRGNQPKLQYHFLTLKKENRIEDYLHYYKEHSDFFDFYEEKYNELVIELYYYHCTFPNKYSKRIPYKYRKHLFSIPGKNITKDDIYNYLNSLPEAIIMHTMNFDLK